MGANGGGEGGKGDNLGAVLDILKQVEGNRTVEDRQTWSQVEELLREEVEAEVNDGDEAAETDDQAADGEESD